MAFPLTVAAVALFYLGAIPVQFAFCLHLDHTLQFGTGVAIFEPRFARRRAMQAPPKERPRPSASLENRDVSLLIRAGFRALKHLLHHLPSRGLMLDGTLGTSDAAVTAMVCGGVNSLGCALRAANVARLNLRPDFSADHVRAEVTGMISAPAGHIMLAALLGAYEYGTGRFNTWKSIPSKA